MPPQPQNRSTTLTDFEEDEGQRGVFPLSSIHSHLVDKVSASTHSGKSVDFIRLEPVISPALRFLKMAPSSVDQLWETTFEASVKSTVCCISSSTVTAFSLYVWSVWERRPFHTAKLPTVLTRDIVIPELPFCPALRWPRIWFPNTPDLSWARWI